MFVKPYIVVTLVAMILWLIGPWELYLFYSKYDPWWKKGQSSWFFKMETQIHLFIYRQNIPAENTYTYIW